MKSVIKRYSIALIMIVLLIFIIILLPESAPAVKKSLFNQLGTLITIIPPIFILLGLFDVWVPRETIINMLGEESGLKGALLAFFLGSAAAGPLYGAFPVAVVMMKKGASLFNVLIFIGAWSTTKIPMFLFESNSLGYRFSLSRLFISILGITSIAFILNKSIRQEDKDKIFRRIEFK